MGAGNPNTPSLQHSIPKVVSAAGLAPAITRSQAEHVAPTLRADGGPEGTRTLSLPADNGLLWLVELRIHKKWWEVLVMLQSSLPTFVLRHRIYRPAAGTPPKIGSGGGNHTHLKKFMRLLSVL